MAFTLMPPVAVWREYFHDVPKSTFYERMVSNRIPGLVLIGGKRYFVRESLESAIESALDEASRTGISKKRGRKPKLKNID